MFLPTAMQKPTWMLSGLGSAGMVFPSITQPVFTTLSPSQTMATTGHYFMYLTSPTKKGWSFRSMEYCFRWFSDTWRNLMFTRWNPFWTKPLISSPTRPSSLIKMKACLKLVLKLVGSGFVMSWPEWPLLSTCDLKIWAAEVRKLWAWGQPRLLQLHLKISK